MGIEISEAKVCCFTGHREISRKNMLILSDLLEDSIEKLIAIGFRSFRAGGAMGFDNLAALKVIEVRRKHPEITLDLFLPCRDQADKWNESERKIYFDILNAADSIVYVEEHYTKGCMFKRNRALVDGSDLCISFRTKENGGTAYTEDYAYSKGIGVINLAPRCLNIAKKQYPNAPSYE